MEGKAMRTRTGHRSSWIALVVPLSLLAACSGIPRQARDNERLERYQQYAGPPIDSFTYLGRYDGWNSLDESHLVVWTGINTAYLITVQPPCNDLRFAERIGLTQDRKQRHTPR
jgi:hypothetical protein